MELAQAFDRVVECYSIYIYHMTLLLFSGWRHVVNIVTCMTTHYIILSTGTSNVITTSVTTMQIFIETSKL